MTAAPPLPPSAWLGVLGGGQLGRMFALAARRLGYRVAVLDPDPSCPASTVASRHLCAPLDDRAALNELARTCPAVTVETEHVPVDTLRALERKCVLRPGATSVAIAQDRIAEKRFVERCGLGVAPWRAAATVQDLDGRLDPWLPGILKSARAGYDGRGQVRVRTREAAIAAFAALGRTRCVLEREVDFVREISIILARGADGRMACFPVFENSHVGGILDVTVVPAGIEPALAEAARSAALRIAARLGHVGVLCVEFFVDRTGNLLVNELAPRPHNSGHLTIEACAASQFEQQVRALAGLPLGDPAPAAPAAMFNLLGDLWVDGEPDWAAVRGVPGAQLHLYGKRAARPQRKMGHVTVLADGRAAALDSVRRLRAALCAQRPREIAA